ncbi:MAG: hypothetical protein M1820_006655 [Bogoriella megaspora]|nr:MAG: hypothetical protein M1820_006655 [Bogoriella megaspora]
MDNQSHFLLLPAELRHKIYFYTLTSPAPFIDPCHYNRDSLQTIKSPFHDIPHDINLSLFLVCRQIHAEASLLGYLHRYNTFQFTTVTHAHTFLSRLPKSTREQIRIVGINLRIVASDNDPCIAEEWLGYTSRSICEGFWAQARLGSIYTDAPGLKALRIGLDGWFQPGEGKHRLEYIKSLVRDLSYLDCVSVETEIRLNGLDLAYAEPWAPELFVTCLNVDRGLKGPYGGKSMVDVLAPAVMSDEVKGRKNGLEIRWRIAKGRIVLEVVRKDPRSRSLSAVDMHRWKTPWGKEYQLASGAMSSSCSWEEYEKKLNTYKPEPVRVAPPYYHPQMVAMAMGGYVDLAQWSWEQS